MARYFGLLAPGLGVLTVAGPAPFLVNPCTNRSSPASSSKWCDAALPIGDRLDDMVSRMSLQEKIGVLGNDASAIPSLQLPPYGWWSEATHGVANWPHGVRNSEEMPFQTNFPFPILTGMSFNRSLWHAVGAQIGREARAFMNAGSAYSTFWAPVVNLAREPRWGRNIETPGEDPYVSGEYAVSFVKGLEQAPEDPYHIQASACCKHFVANEMEHATEGGQTHTRHNFDATITAQDLVDSYMAPFQACVEKGRVSGLMCSYNAVNGVPTCASSWLLKDVAREAWGFDGYITSDCGAEDDVFAHHNFTKTPEESLRDILRAGTDSDCGGFAASHAQSAMDKQMITEGDLDERLRMLFRVRMRLGHFDPPGPLDSIPASTVCSDYAKVLARDSVTQSVALVKNIAKRLPLAASTSVAVIGPNAVQNHDITGYYGPATSCDNKFWTLVDAVQPHAQKTLYAAGLPSPLSTNTSGFGAAAKLAAQADDVVLVLGTDLSSAHEEMDAKSIALPPQQLELLRAVTAAASKPVVVVMLTAVPLDISELVSDTRVGAIIHAGQPSVQTLGIGDILFGARSPAGRLIQTMYPTSYADQVSIFDFNMRPGKSAFPRPDCGGKSSGPCPLGDNPGRTYRFYTGSAVFPFGYGLSYTTFEYDLADAPDWISLAPLPGLLQRTKQGFVSFADQEAVGPAAKYVVSVKNTGDVDADDVVLGFVTPPGAGQDGVPLKSLFAFERVHVPVGTTVHVTLYPSLMEFSQVDKKGARTVVTGEYRVSFGLKESADKGMGFVEHTVLADFEGNPVSI